MLKNRRSLIATTRKPGFVFVGQERKKEKKCLVDSEAIKSPSLRIAAAR